ncbi:MAG: aminotransferase class I/II-fold pyridoxal phosphate-dependent enzyme [Candidatus Eisenbacteria bacterium]|uniref:Aminotransferase class I/II-fold pyridoxal phosphate-dependent enzyme n=1 Tax=Eiseniibacteriota bacterium TaxID=2212470 RepID=A0A849SRJ3_UNCEI|nr:aminotransferase class I/II-fold pyridoxal phosphate-dependent enzyme [Candidatus Eisenbacteria bacterium]
MSTPIVHSSTFGFESLDAMNDEQQRGAASAYYQRVGHPTVHVVERRLADLEGAEAALLFPSGMAAISSAFLAYLKHGDHVVALDQCYGGTHDLLQWGSEHFGWQYTLVDGREPDRFEAAFRANTRLFHVESPTNPMLCVVDLDRGARLAHSKGALFTCDNTYASPIGQHPLAHGADLVMHSATKSIGGHSDLLAGFVAGARQAVERVWKVRKVFGPMPDPALAWQIERSLKTLALRLTAMNANAAQLAAQLSTLAGIRQVYYPGLAGHPGHAIAARQMPLGFGHVVSIDVIGGAAAAEAVVNHLRLIRHAPSLGGVDSLASLPAHTSHIQLGAEGRARAGIPEGVIRLSIGVEDAVDLWADLVQALAKVPAAVR